MIQYMSEYVPGTFSGGRSPGSGTARHWVHGGVRALNWFGIQLFALINGALTVAKFVVPAITIIALFVSGFHESNFSSHGGFAPYGWAPGLSAIATAGIIYAYTGFHLPPAFAVAHNGSGIPRRALLINFVLGIAFLLPFGSWQQIVAATSVLRADRVRPAVGVGGDVRTQRHVPRRCAALDVNARTGRLRARYADHRPGRLA